MLANNLTKRDEGMSHQSQNIVLPPKNIASALLFAVFLGPVGLLYSSFRGGFFMTVLGVIVVCSKLPFPIILVWLSSCIWAVGAAEKYNRDLVEAARAI